MIVIPFNRNVLIFMGSAPSNNGSMGTRRRTARALSSAPGGAVGPGGVRPGRAARSGAERCVAALSQLARGVPGRPVAAPARQMRHAPASLQ